MPRFHLHLAFAATLAIVAACKVSTTAGPGAVTSSGTGGASSACAPACDAQTEWCDPIDDSVPTCKPRQGLHDPTGCGLRPLPGIAFRPIRLGLGLEPVRPARHQSEPGAPRPNSPPVAGIA